MNGFNVENALRASIDIDMGRSFIGIGRTFLIKNYPMENIWQNSWIYDQSFIFVRKEKRDNLNMIINKIKHKCTQHNINKNMSEINKLAQHCLKHNIVYI